MHTYTHSMCHSFTQRCLTGKIEQLDVASSNPHRIMTTIWHLMNPRANRNHFSCLHSTSIALLQLHNKVQSNTQVLVQNNKCLLIMCKRPYVFIEKKFLTVLHAWAVLGWGENRLSSLLAAHSGRIHAQYFQYNGTFIKTFFVVFFFIVTVNEGAQVCF